MRGIQLSRRSKSIHRRGLDPFDIDLLRHLKSVTKPKSTSQIAEATHMAWQTARKHLQDLFNRGYVERRILPNKILWRHRKVS